MSLKITRNDEERILTINDTEFSYEIFEHLANPNPDHFYRMCKHENQVIVETWKETDDNSNAVKIAKF